MINYPPLVDRPLGSDVTLAKPVRKDFGTLFALEGGHGFRSTYFLRHDGSLARPTASYSFQREEIRTITRMIQDAGGEVGAR